MAMQQQQQQSKRCTSARLLAGTPFNDSLLLQKPITLETFVSPFQVGALSLNNNCLISGVCLSCAWL
jgi:hypothetical protein